MRWGGLPYARQYAEQVAAVYQKDAPDRRYAATRAVVHNLARAMLIKDPVFIAELATSPEKYARDRLKYNVNRANGDRIRYRHLWPCRIRIGPWTLRRQTTFHSWQLQILKRSRWLRKVVPAWGAPERAFRRRYQQHVAEFTWNTADEYRRQLTQLASPKCMDCTNPRCRDAGCPLGGDIPGWLDLYYQQRWEEAARALHESNNFPEFTARICPALCQDSCKQGLVGFEVQIQDAERQIVERAFEEGWVAPQPAERKNGRSVAVIGSGPAGMAAAQELAREGHDVVVFEKDPAPGGLLRYGIPDERLDKGLVDRRIEQLTAEGVEFRAGVRVGRDVTAEQLREDFDAILLATGAARPRDLDVRGRQNPGIHFALDYLRQENFRLAGQYVSDTDAISAKDKVVAVVGGGLTGEDCVETALAQGAKEVHQFEILPKPEERTVGSYEHDPDAVSRRWCVATKGFGGNGDGLTELQAVRVQWVNSAQGPVMKELPESEFRMKVDLAVLALGFDPIVDPDLAAQLGLKADPDGKIQLTGLDTGVEGVFAAGDLVTGPAYVVTAIASGRAAAQRIARHLQATATKTIPITAKATA